MNKCKVTAQKIGLAVLIGVLGYIGESSTKNKNAFAHAVEKSLEFLDRTNVVDDLFECLTNKKEIRCSC